MTPAIRRRFTAFSRAIPLLLLAAAVRPPISEAAVSKEDPGTTAEMREKTSDLRNAYAAHNVKAYQSALIPLLRDAVKQPVDVLIKRYASLEVLAKESLDGMQPIIYRYAKSIFKNGPKIDAVTLKELRGSVPLAQSTWRSPFEAPCAQVVRDAVRGHFPEADDLAGLSCLEADQAVQGQTLTTAGISLPAHDACETMNSNLIYLLNIPASIPSASITWVEVVNLPFPLVLTSSIDYANWRWVAIAPVQFPGPLPVDAQSESFTVRVTTTTGVTNFPVHVPINRGIQYWCGQTTVPVGIGNTWNWRFFGNGPRDPRTWSSVAAGPLGLPAGLSFAQGTGSYAGDGVVTGTVEPTAVNGAVDISFVQSAVTKTKRFSFQVTLRPEPLRTAELVAPQAISRGQSVSFRLPDGQGADGTYNWHVYAQYTLPAGLAIVHNSGGWFVEGIVDSHATLEVRTVKLEIGSAGQSALLTLTFDSRQPVRVHTQNMILFPPDIVNPTLDCSPALLSPWPWVTYGACVALFQTVDDAIYNNGINPNGVRNTADDNYERASYLIDHIMAEQYDVVGLQEVWDGPLTEAEVDHLVNGTSGSYRSLQGAGAGVGFIPPSFHISAGLLTLVKPAVNQPAPIDHVEIFSNAGGGIDSWSNKGFTATQLFISDDPSEYVWVINTHTHAEERHTRQDQIHQIQDYIATLPTTNPVIVMGDLNVIADENASRGPLSDYALMTNALVGFQDIALGHNFLTSDWYLNEYKHQWSDEEPATRLDYILVRPGTIFDLDPDTVDIVNSLPTVRYTTMCTNWALSSSIHCHYSDHFGLKATLRFRHR